jgi:hypothetical protein
VKTAGSHTVYLVINGGLRPFSSAAIFLARGLRFADIQIISDDQLATGTVGRIMGYPDGTLIRGSASTVYVVSGDSKLGIPTAEILKRLNPSNKKIIRLSDTDLANYDDGGIQN